MKRLDSSQPPLANASTTVRTHVTQYGEMDNALQLLFVQRQNPLVKCILAVIGVYAMLHENESLPAKCF